VNCQDKEAAFNEGLAAAQAQLKIELDAIAADTEAKAKEIADEFEADHDLAGGVGAAVGTAVGAAVGGPVGGPVGGAIGKLIGSLFTLEVGMRRQNVSLDIPQTTMRTRDFSFDLPTVVLRDTDIIFDLPTIEMRRQRGPDIPETVVRMETRCIGGHPFRVCADVPVVYIEMKESYFHMPVTVMRPVRIVVGLPTVEMRRQDFKMDVPEITMKTADFSADIPYVTLRFMKDAGKRTTAQAAALAQSAQDAALRSEIGFKDRMRMAVAPLCADMFECFRSTLEDGRRHISAQYQPQIDQLTAAVTSLKAQQLPDTDPNVIATLNLLNAALQQRDDALKPIEGAIEQLAASAKASLEQFLGMPAGTGAPKGAKTSNRTSPKGGLISHTAVPAAQPTQPGREGGTPASPVATGSPNAAKGQAGARRGVPGLVNLTEAAAP